MIARTKRTGNPDRAAELGRALLPAFSEYERWHRMRRTYEAAHQHPHQWALLNLVCGERMAAARLLQAADSFIVQGVPTTIAPPEGVMP